MPQEDGYLYDLGSFTRKITTSSGTAQKWFNRGLIWSYAFHHEEAVVCFEKAVEEDGEASMAYWGLSYALGPNYNKPWEMFDAKELETTLLRIIKTNELSEKYANKGTPLEIALVQSIRSRVPEGSSEADFKRSGEKYADAMQKVYEQFSDDLDVAALYADALMNLSAWNLWDLRTGEPTPESRAVEAKAVLDKALKNPDSKKHPGILHLYIHLMEMSPTPEAALVPADHLRTLCPHAGHLVHMPSHLDILIGDYRRGIASNADACLADEMYLSQHPDGLGFYTFYRLHDYHSLIYAAMFAGQKEVCLEAVGRLEKSLPESLLRVESPPMADWMEAFVSVRVHVYVRFGMWEKLLAMPFPDDKVLYSVTTATLHYGKGVAYAATGDVENAERERQQLEEATARVQPERVAGDFPNKSKTVLGVARAMLEGEVEYRKGNFERAFECLQLAIERDDALHYAEPWPWMQPTRHAYAALLLEQGRVEEAAKAYAADLGLDDTLPRARWHPGNVWALHGYKECLDRLGRVEEEKIVGQQLKIALAVADVDVKASCYCRGAAKVDGVEGGKGGCC